MLPRFSEVYVPELEDRLDLKRVVSGYISGVAVDHESLAFTAVDLYLWARKLSSESLSDGAGQRPRYSLRSGDVTTCVLVSAKVVFSRFVECVAAYWNWVVIRVRLVFVFVERLTSRGNDVPCERAFQRRHYFFSIELVLHDLLEMLRLPTFPDPAMALVVLRHFSVLPHPLLNLPKCIP